MAGLPLPANVPVAELQNFVRDTIVNPNLRKSIFLSRLKDKKCILYNQSGTDACTWPVKHSRRDITEVDGFNTPQEMPYVMQHDQASVPWSGYRMGDSIPKMLRLMNAKGPNRVFALFEDRLKDLTGDFLEAYRYRLWQDGNRTKAGLHGLLSMFGSDSTPSYFSSPESPVYNRPTTYTEISRADGGTWWAMQPTATYAGVSTVLGARDNTWNGLASEAWPAGNFSPTYCYWSPVITNYLSGAFDPNPGLANGTTPAARSWKSQWQQAVNRTIAYLEDIRGAGVDTVLLTAAMLADCMDSTIGQQRFEAGEMGMNGDDVALGIRNVSYNGRQFLTEFSVPSGCAFLLPISKVHLLSMQGDIIGNQKDMDIVTLEDLFALDAFTQLRVESPAFCGLLTAGTSGS